MGLEENLWYPEALDVQVQLMLVQGICRIPVTHISASQESASQSGFAGNPCSPSVLFGEIGIVLKKFLLQRFKVVPLFFLLL